MTITKCYIENFGGISKQTFNFTDGLNIINKPNGFGKTTLAEFIRVMFYGFTGKGRDIEANDRKRYYPWNNGKFGGNIEFTVNDKSYRLERYFGKTAKGDTFSLYDVVTNKVSKDYSTNIGVEIFNLDSESFIRSIYIKHNNSNFDNFGTDSIRAKLGNLVEDTNDVNNYNKAIKAIDEKVKQLKSPQRVQSVTRSATELVYQLEVEMSKLNSIISEKTCKEEQLAECNKEIRQIHSDIENIRKEIADVAKLEGRNTVLSQLSSLEAELKELENKVQAIEEEYTNGFPIDDELCELEELYDKSLKLSSIVDDTNVKQAESIVERLRPKFKDGTPEDLDITACTDNIKQFNQISSKIKDATIPTKVQENYKVMREFFRDGVPSEDEIGEYTKLYAEIEKDRATLQAVGLQDTLSRKSLIDRVFISGVPDSDSIESMLFNLDKADRLRKVNSNLALGIEDSVEVVETPVEHTSSNNKKILIGIGGLLVIGGVIGCFLNLAVVGITAIILGVALAIIGIAVKPKVIVEKIKTNIKVNEDKNESIRQSIQDNNDQIQQIELTVSRFISKYINDGRGLREKILELKQKVSEYNAIELEIKQKTSEEISIKQSILENEARIEDWITRFNGTLSEFNKSVAALRSGIEAYNSYTTTIENCTKELEELNPEKQRLYKLITDFLLKYFENLDGDLIDYVAQLKIQKEQYSKAVEVVNNHRNSLSSRANELQSIQGRMSEIANTYGLKTLLDRRSILEIRTNKQYYFENKQRIAIKISEIEKINENNKELLGLEIIHSGRSLEELRHDESAKSNKLADYTEVRIELEKKIEAIREAEDKLPLVEDARDYYVELRNEANEQARLLEYTSAMLTSAKESLATSYMGKLVKSFTKYLEYLMPEDAEETTVDTEIGINVVRLGQSRTKACLSSGQLDVMNICMRLALIESMFEFEKPFIILDDPFTNLDDNAVTNALEILRKLGETQQIVYMTCSDSRAE